MVATGIEGVGLLIGRLLFGGIIAFMGMNHFMNREEMIGYATHKGLPMPAVGVYVSGAVLVLGGLGLVTGVFPVLSGLAIALFLIVAAITMHDFWAVPEAETQNEMIHFLKNMVMMGGALAFAAVGTQAWAYSVGIGLF